MSRREPTIDAELETLQRQTFSYFVHETNPANGLVIDNTVPDWPASIAAVGLALAAYPVAVERGFIARAEAVERVLTTLRFFWTSPHRISARGCGEQGSAGGGYEDTKTCHSRSRAGPAAPSSGRLDLLSPVPRLR